MSLRGHVKIRTRLTVTTGVVVGCVCVLVSASLLFFIHDRQSRFRGNLLQDAALRTVSLIVRSTQPQSLSGFYRVQVQVIDPNGSVIAATHRLAGKPRIATFQPPDSVFTYRHLCPPKGMSGCQMVLVYPLHLYHVPGTWLVYAAAPDVPWYVTPWFLLVLIGTGVALILLTMLMTWLNVSRALRPVAAISSEMRDITAKDLSHRVPVPKHQDEIGNLANTVNGTLDRLEQAVFRLTRFTSDASHDLRNPITAMRVEVEDVLMHPTGVDPMSLASRMLTGLERFEAIVEDLLELARLDSPVPVIMTGVDLGELAAAEVTGRAQHKRIVTITAEGVQVIGNRMKLTRLLANLIDNAERHAEATVTLAVYRESGKAVLTVTDDGEGIAPEYRDLVFQRFARLDASRKRDSSGTGLGLPIAREVAEQHGGSLVIENSPRGARFVLRLPLSDQEPPAALCQPAIAGSPT
jgi:signal transduction histidine kinase